MSADFWASYLSGALGILIGNHLDVIKVQYQAGFTTTSSSASSSASSILPRTSTSTSTSTASTASTTAAEFRPGNGGATAAKSKTKIHVVTNYFRGAAAPILGYGALNSILFVTYNRTVKALDPAALDAVNDNYSNLAGTDLSKIWLAGAIGGLATFVVSTPTELVKCRTQLQSPSTTTSTGSGSSSYVVFRQTLRSQGGIRGLYKGGVVTAVRDSVGYGWYFWTYELCKRLLIGSRSADPFVEMKAWETLVAGGVAGVATWASIYPLDVIKTRVQTGIGTGITATGSTGETESLLQRGRGGTERKGATSFQVAKQVWHESGLKGFYRGLGICSLRAFIVNAVQWYCYEQVMGLLTRVPSSSSPSKLEVAV